MKKILHLFFIALPAFLSGQSPIGLTVTAEKKDPHACIIHIATKVPAGWHVYAATDEAGGIEGFAVSWADKTKKAASDPVFNIPGAIFLQERMGGNPVVVTVLPDSNKKYLSTDLLREEKQREGQLSGSVELPDYGPCCATPRHSSFTLFSCVVLFNKNAQRGLFLLTPLFNPFSSGVVFW